MSSDNNKPQGFCYDFDFSATPCKLRSKSGKIFFVHSTILAKHKPFSPEGSLPLKGGEELNLSQWDDSTVERFVYYLYTGDYKHWIDPDFSKKDECLDEGVKDLSKANISRMVQSFPQEEGLGSKDTNILLVHAKLSGLAAQMEVVSLHRLAYNRLRGALSSLEDWNVSSIKKIRELAEDLDSFIDAKGRGLVVEFVSKNVEHIIFTASDAFDIAGGPKNKFTWSQASILIWKSAERIRKNNNKEKENQTKIDTLEKELSYWRDIAVTRGRQRDVLEKRFRELRIEHGDDSAKNPTVHIRGDSRPKSPSKTKLNPT